VRNEVLKEALPALRTGSRPQAEFMENTSEELAAKRRKMHKNSLAFLRLLRFFAAKRI
jgi:hypothetical protein